MTPSCRDWTKSEGLLGSSLLASGREAARTLKDEIFGAEMRKGEEFLALRSKKEDGHGESPLMVKVSGEEENGWKWESSWGENLAMAMRFAEEDEEGDTERLCILEFAEDNKEESEWGDIALAWNVNVVSYSKFIFQNGLLNIHYISECTLKFMFGF